MTTTTPAYEFWFKTSRNGQRRAYHYSFCSDRVMPYPADKAEVLIATGRATEINMCWRDALRAGVEVVTIR